MKFVDLENPNCGAIYPLANVDLYKQGVKIDKSNDNYYLYGLPLILSCGISEYKHLKLNHGDQAIFKVDASSGIKINNTKITYDEIYNFEAIGTNLVIRIKNGNSRCLLRLEIPSEWMYPILSDIAEIIKVIISPTLN